MRRRSFLKAAGAAVAVLALPLCLTRKRSIVSILAERRALALESAKANMVASVQNVHWKNYTSQYTFTKKEVLLAKMRKALKLTKFRPPVDPGIYTSYDVLRSVT